MLLRLDIVLLAEVGQRYVVMVDRIVRVQLYGSGVQLDRSFVLPTDDCLIALRLR